MKTDPDAGLVRKLKDGDVQAFEALLEKYQARIYRVALKIVRSPEDAEEICQDAFLTVHRKIHTFQGQSAFFSWLYRVALNFAYMKLRRRKRREIVSLESQMPQFDDDGNHLQRVPDWSPKADDQLLEGQLQARLREFVDELPEKYRTVFVLRDIEELSNEEVAEIMELTVAAVKSRLHRARLHLRERVSELLSEGSGDTQ